MREILFRMKKLIFALLFAVMIIGLCGCGHNKVQAENTGNDGRITILYNDGFCLIYRDNETGVQYIARAQAGITVMLNPDGTPYTGNLDK